MKLDDYEWRQIKFQGVELPQTVMAISVLTMLKGIPEDTIDWLWKIRHCCGVEKCESGIACAKHADIILSELHSKHDEVSLLVEKNLGTHGFTTEQTIADWTNALIRIRNVGAERGELACTWCAPRHPKDRYSDSGSLAGLIEALSRIEKQ